jgi:hypothetical protein
MSTGTTMTFRCCVYFGRGADAHLAFRDVSYPWTDDEFNVFHAHGEATTVKHVYALCEAFFGKKPGDDNFNTTVEQLRLQIASATHFDGRKSLPVHQSLSDDDFVAVSLRIDVLRANIDGGSLGGGSIGVKESNTSTYANISCSGPPFTTSFDSAAASAIATWAATSSVGLHQMREQHAIDLPPDFASDLP